MPAACVPINIVVPKKSMLTPEYPAAVVAGNVETSQAVTNCLFGAPQGARGRAGHHEQPEFRQQEIPVLRDICSGSPAGPGFDGTDAVHTHMTNTRLTDPEILEFRYPVLLEDFHIRNGSGGKGRWKAGDGIRRTIRFLEKMECTLLTGHRNVPPFGLEGGEAGQVGREFRAPQGRPRGKTAGLRRDRDRCRRSHHHPDTDRGRIREAGRAQSLSAAAIRRYRFKFERLTLCIFSRKCGSKFVRESIICAP
jgi:5-oxoprolinase (ATP-hydrolysing)